VIDNKLTLGVAEGIETALASRLGSGIPTWSCMSANGMKSFIWSTGLESLVIFADHDKHGVGQTAAWELAARAAAAGLEVRVLVPETVGADWLDIYVGEIA
jgi:putative DNA primase/helicase